MPEALRLTDLAAAGGPIALETPATVGRAASAKRAFDVVVASALLVAASPLVVAVAALVEITSPGSAFRAEWRVGRGGRPFRMYSFRTTRLDPAADELPVWAERRAPRVTLVGRFLRATGLDALPRLVNVAKGDMSLVGPRPERPETARNLACIVPNYAARLAVRPGMTGLAQVRARESRGAPRVRRALAEDLLYVRRMRWTLDVGILVRRWTRLAASPRRA